MQLKPFAAALACVALLCVGVLSLRSITAQIAKTDGTAMTAGGTPSLSACGTSPTLGPGATDMSGIITVGSGVTTSCTLTFSTTLVNPPACVVATSLSSVAAGVTTTTTTLVSALSLTLGGGKLYYVCFGL